MTKISIDEVKKLALLSRISITDQEAEKLGAQLSSILDYVSQLNEIDTTDVETTSQVTGLVNVERDDELEDYSTDRKKLLENAPYQEDGYIKVKRILR